MAYHIIASEYVSPENSSHDRAAIRWNGIKTPSGGGDLIRHVYGRSYEKKKEGEASAAAANMDITAAAPVPVIPSSIRFRRDDKCCHQSNPPPPATPNPLPGAAVSGLMREGSPDFAYNAWIWRKSGESVWIRKSQDRERIEIGTNVKFISILPRN